MWTGLDAAARLNAAVEALSVDQTDPMVTLEAALETGRADRALDALSDSRLRFYTAVGLNPARTAWAGAKPLNCLREERRWRDRWAASEPAEAWARFTRTPLCVARFASPSPRRSAAFLTPTLPRAPAWHRRRWRYERPASRGRDVTHRILARSLLLVNARYGDAMSKTGLPPSSCAASLGDATRTHYVMRTIAAFAGRPEVVIAVRQRDIVVKALLQCDRLVAVPGGGARFDAIARRLVEYGAPFDDLTAPAPEAGPNELHIACTVNAPQTALALLQRGANFRLISHDGTTALWQACRSGMEEGALSFVCVFVVLLFCCLVVLCACALRSALPDRALGARRLRRRVDHQFNSHRFTPPFALPLWPVSPWRRDAQWRSRSSSAARRGAATSPTPSAARCLAQSVPQRPPRRVAAELCAGGEGDTAGSVPREAAGLC